MDTQKYEVLMNVASGLYIVCYIPELYANYKNKNANIWNLPEKVFILIGTSLALSYAVINDNDALIINYAPLFALDFISFLMRAYYVVKNHNMGVNPYIQQKDPVPPARAPI